MPIVYIFWVSILFFIWKLFWEWRRKQICAREFFLWFIFWIFAGIAVLFVRKLDSLAQLFFGVERAADLGVYVAIAVLFYFVYRVFVRLEKIDHEITSMIRKDALKNSHEEKKDSLCQK